MANPKFKSNIFSNKTKQFIEYNDLKSQRCRNHVLDLLKIYNIVNYKIILDEDIDSETFNIIILLIENENKKYKAWFNIEKIDSALTLLIFNNSNEIQRIQYRTKKNYHWHNIIETVANDIKRNDIGED